MTPTPLAIAAKSLRRRRRLLAALFRLALAASVTTGGLAVFQLWQVWQFDEPSWLALAGCLGGVAALAGVASLLRRLLAWYGAESALIAGAEALTTNRQPLPCHLEIPEYPRRVTKHPVPLARLRLPADEFSEARAEIVAFGALNVPPRDGGDGLLWQGNPDGKPIRVVAFGQRLLTGHPVTEDTFRQMLARQAKTIASGVVLGGVLVVGLMTGFVALEALELQDRLHQARHSAAWPTAPGVVLVSETREAKISRGKRQVAAYRAFVLYSYLVGGKSFEGRNLHFAYQPDTRREAADEIARRYREGAPVAVYHHPQHPRISTLEPGHADELREPLDNRIVLLFLMPLTLLIVGALLAAVMPLAMKAHESRCLAFIRRC